MKYFVVIKLVCVCFSLTFSSCDYCSYETGKKEYYEVINHSKTESSNAGMIQRFSSYPIEKQIDIYLYARNCPDNPSIEPLLVKDGEGKILAIVERIKTADRVLDKVYLLGVLSSINIKCKCISKDSEAIQSLETVEKELSENKDTWGGKEYKEIYSTRLKSLKERLNEK